MIKSQQIYPTDLNDTQWLKIRPYLPAKAKQGDSATISFYPRKGKITVYLMDGTVRYAELLARLGKHTTRRVCVYIKRLSDVELPILEQIVGQSYKYVKSQDGHMHRALE